MSNFQIVLLEPAKELLRQVSKFSVYILLVAIILIVGWVFAKVVRDLITRGLKAIKLDQLSDRIELENILSKGGIGYSLSELIGIVCYWVVLLIAVVTALNAIHLTVAAELLNRIIYYIPNVISAIFMLVIGMFVATLLSNIVQTAANNAGLAESRILSKVVQALVMIFAIAIALEQLNIGAKIIEIVIGILVGSMGLAVALAFGLGCKDIAGKAVAEFLDKIKKK
ncbi:hypothetical protein D4R78_07370 [bacterium]|nr:MAG: hypothetical protein D4R78_07370 [bacterium]